MHLNYDSFHPAQGVPLGDMLGDAAVHLSDTNIHAPCILSKCQRETPSKQNKVSNYVLAPYLRFIRSPAGNCNNADASLVKRPSLDSTSPRQSHRSGVTTANQHTNHRHRKQ